MSYKRKTIDTWELQVNYGYGHGFESECVEFTRKEAIQRKREYAENCPQYPTRIVLKREKIEVKNAKIKIICISYADSGRHYRSMPLDELSDGILNMIRDDIEGNNFTACIFELPLAAWLNRHDSRLYCYAHTSHYLNEQGVELCLGDFI